MTLNISFTSTALYFVFLSRMNLLVSGALQISPLVDDETRSGQ